MARIAYKTNLEQWKRELSAELKRDVTYEEIASGTDLAYSTLQKHVSHAFRRPDLATASRICAFFNEKSVRKNRTPVEYFLETEVGQSVAVGAA